MKIKVIGLVFLLALVTVPAPGAYAPSILLSKDHTPSRYYFHRGDTITYTLELRVTASTSPPDSIQNTILTDTLPAGLSYVTGSQVSTPASTFSQSGQVLKWDFGSAVLTGAPQAVVSFSVTVDATAAGQRINYASCSFDYVAPLSGPGSAGPTPDPIFVLVPGISIVKTPSAAMVEAGGSVTYTYAVANTGNCALTGVTVVDDKLGTIASGLSLAVGASQTFTATASLSASTTNTATATGADPLGASVSASASATVRVIHPGISVTKTPSVTVLESGGSVTYTYIVTNTGDVALTDVSLTDDKLGVIASGFSLAVGESRTFTGTTTLTSTTTNTVTATGKDPLGVLVSAEASATVTVIHPGIHVTKSPSAVMVEVGGSVTYTYVVTNTGDVALSDVSVVDDKLGVVASGFSLAVGESRTFTATTTLTATTTNTATAAGVDPLGIKVTAAASATVTVIDSKISLTKTPSATTIAAGGSVTYTYVVTNTGNSPLTNVAVTDDKLGVVASGFSLAVGESRTFTATATLSASTTNTGTATGVDPLGKTVTASAQATVTVIHPAIALTKTPSVTQVNPGGPVTYTYVVTNTGDTQLTSVQVTDDKLGVIASGVTLAPGASQTFTKTTTLSVTTTNTATATGTDPLGHTVSAQASATVTVTAASEGTRTQGFWSTHTEFTWAIWQRAPAGWKTLGTKNLADKGVFFGGFTASISKTSTGAKRSPLDQARMQLVHQLLSAELNVLAFGPNAAAESLIAQAIAAYNGSNASLILGLAAKLDAYNNSGDSLPFPPGTPSPGPATPGLTRQAANVPAWNNLP